MDDDGVWFKCHLNGDRHRFTPEISMHVQHQLGADIMFAFDELHHAAEHPRLPGGVGSSGPGAGPSAASPSTSG